VGGFDAEASFTQSPVARLASITPEGGPHLVPVVFAVSNSPGLPASPDGAMRTVYTAIDAKPKTTQRLRRLANIESNPQVSLLVDHYADDWTQLWWVRVDGVAAIHREGAVLDTGHRLLRAKYPQYQSVPLNGPVIAVTVGRWSSWHA
jgi:PPOX class probable F420-dependent enzyme